MTYQIHDPGPTIVGVINLDENGDLFDLYNEDASLKFPTNKLTLAVFTNEGEILPHFHIYDTNGSVDCCLMINHPRFFVHDNHNKPVSSKQMKTINSWLQKPSRKFGHSGSNWEFLAMNWINSEDFEKTNKQPDYTLAFKNPFDLIFKSSIKSQSKNIHGYKYFEGEIINRPNTKAIILSNQHLFQNTNVEVLSILELTYSNEEVFICRPENDKSKYSKSVLNKISSTIADTYYRHKVFKKNNSDDYKIK